MGRPARRTEKTIQFHKFSLNNTLVLLYSSKLVFHLKGYHHNPYFCTYALVCCIYIDLNVSCNYCNSSHYQCVLFWDPGAAQQPRWQWTVKGERVTNINHTTAAKCSCAQVLKYTFTALWNNDATWWDITAFRANASPELLSRQHTVEWFQKVQ